MEGPISRVVHARPAQAAVALLASAGLLSAMAGCGSSSDDTAAAAGDTVAKKEAIGVLGVNLRVINQGPANMVIVICSADACKPGQELAVGQVADMSASSVHGSYYFNGPGWAGPVVKFEAGNPAIGKPYITAHRQDTGGGGFSWYFSEGSYVSLCYDVDGVGTVGGQRDSDISDYKRLVMKPRSEGSCPVDYPPWGTL